MLVQMNTKQLPFANESIDHIYTDPPYLGRNLETYCWLANEAMRVLKPGGFLLAMMGGTYKNRIYRFFDDAGLAYFWDYAFVMPGGRTETIWKNHPTNNPAGNRPIVVRVKNILAYTKGQGLPRTPTIDLINVMDGGQNWKQYHKWGQSTAVARYYIDCFTAEGDLVCDPFLGGGSTAIACRLINRRFVGGDIDPAALLASYNHLNGKGEPMPAGSMFAGQNLNGHKEPLYQLSELPARAGLN